MSGRVVESLKDLRRITSVGTEDAMFADSNSLPEVANSSIRTD
jgi:hypothetical protein